MKVLKLGVILLMASIFTWAHADDKNCQNQISMQLQEEGWVTSKTALVTVSIQAAMSKDNSSQLISTISEKLKSIVKNSASWRLIDLSMEKNTAGLLAVSAKMSARLNNDQLAQLQNAIDTLNKAGEQYKIENVDYQPQLSEIAAENTRLRGLVYRDVLEQQKAINIAFVGANYQLQTLNFEMPYLSSTRPMLMYAGNSLGAARQASTTSATPFSQQILLSANVTFSSPNIACEKLSKND